ncbi:hypothetical protein ID866_8102 [Astraeus odoratus]|nr:hypothetical protein ID866_8102 [Astraeus odoratus]
MESLVGQQQMLIEVVRESKELKEPQEMQREGSGGQEEIEEGAPEDVAGDKLENGTGAEDGTGEEKPSGGNPG